MDQQRKPSLEFSKKISLSSFFLKTCEERSSASTAMNEFLSSRARKLKVCLAKEFKRITFSFIQSSLREKIGWKTRYPWPPFVYHDIRP